MSATHQARTRDPEFGRCPPRGRFRHVRVERSVSLSPTIQRVTLTGPELAGFHPGRPAAHVRLLLPPPGHVTVPIPTRPPGQARRRRERHPIARTFTPRRFDPTTRRLDIDVACHGDGVATTWAQLARPGDRAAVVGPAGGYDPDPEAAWFLLAGDETAMPAMIAITGALPPGVHARIFVEVPTLRDAQDFDTRADLDVRWLPRRDAPTGHLLEPAVRATTPPPGDGRVWLAGEATLVRRLRDHLLGDAGLAPRRVALHAYWKDGSPNHPDDDHGMD